MPDNSFQKALREHRAETSRDLLELPADIHEHRAETTRELQEFRDDIKRLFDVVAESLRADNRLLADGHQMLLEGRARLADRIDSVDRELRMLMMSSYSDLDRHLRALESARSNPLP